MTDGGGAGPKRVCRLSVGRLRNLGSYNFLNSEHQRASSFPPRQQAKNFRQDVLEQLNLVKKGGCMSSDCTRYVSGYCCLTII